ncbi:MAG: discoidin domain-containing protein, partial [Chloroflexi bacterium]|nr:discoidin domain-containing protein [Chloroflexota bacterium]
KKVPQPPSPPLPTRQAPTHGTSARIASDSPSFPRPAPKFDESRVIGLPNYIAGLVDAGGEAHLLAAGKPGWIVVRAPVGNERRFVPDSNERRFVPDSNERRFVPPDSSGNYTHLADKGLGVIVILTNGSAPNGAIPNSVEYELFAGQCAAFVKKSHGARIWVIGNEPNAARERPSYDGASNSGELITPEMYARCFNLVRKAIRVLPGHEHDFVVPAAVAPFNTQTTYPGNPSGDWVRYFADMLFQITAQGGGADALALHTHTHGYDANFVTSDAKGTNQFQNRHWHFRAYRDFLAAVLPALRSLPVFITAASPLDPGWTNANRGWMNAALHEINGWNGNATNQPIQAVCFARWQSIPGDPPGWGLADKPLAVNDLRTALQNDFRLRWPGLPPTPDYKAQWINVVNAPQNQLTTNEVVSGRVVVKNVGAKAWLAGGANPVRLSYRWYNAQGVEIPLAPTAEHFALAQNILPGQTAVIENVKLCAPQWQGEYVVKFDLIQEGRAWFSAFNSPTRDVRVTIQAPPYALEWENVLNVTEKGMALNSNVIGAVTVKNLGSRTWSKAGPANVRLGYRWYNAQGIQIHVTPYAGNFEMDADTPPGGAATFSNLVLHAPSAEGMYTLRWDVVQEGVTWFSQQGAETFDQVVTVYTPIPDYAVKWVNLFLDVRGSLEPNETVTGTVTVQNIGAKTWRAAGEAPVRLGYHWYDADGNAVELAAYPGNFSLRKDVPPQALATFENVVVRAPVPQAKYKLAFDLVHEGVTWFSAAGAKPFDAQVAVKTDAPPYVAQWQEIFGIPNNQITAGETVSGNVVVRNIGANLWQMQGADAVALGYRWFNALGVEVDAPTYPGPCILPNAIAPRESVTFENVEIHTPATPGEYTLRFDLQRGSAWFADGASAAAETQVRIKAPPLEWGAEFLTHNTPAHLTIGQIVDVALHIANNGKRTWQTDGEHPVHIAYQWFISRASGDPKGASDGLASAQFDVQEFRTALPHDVKPGEQVDFAASLAAPNTPGTYQLHWDLIAEGISWFADGGNPALVLPVNVTVAPTATTLWRAEASHNGASAILAIDGDLGSFWTSQAQQTPGMWFRVDLGEARLIDGIAFRSPGHAYPFAYTVRISSDGQAWRTVHAVAQGNLRDVVATFAPSHVLYAQIDLLAPYEAEWMISEVQIHPCPAWHGTASNNNDYAQNAIDNNPNTAWTTVDAQAPNMWFQLDLGRIESVSGLRLTPPKDEMPCGYRVSVWNQQAGGWQKIAEKQANTEPINISFAPVQTQYLNLQLLNPGETPFAIREARVTKAMTDWVGPLRVPAKN